MNAPNIKGTRYQNLLKYINKFKPKSIMEIGVYDGQHAKLMIEAALKHQPEVKYIGFDLFERISDKEIISEHSKPKKFTYEFVRSFLEKIPKAKVELYIGYTKDTIPLIPCYDIDLIFQDGGHSLETIETDWNNIQRFMHDRTVTLLDDYWIDRVDAGCKLLVDSLTLDPKWSVALLNPIDAFLKPKYQDEKLIRMVRVMKKS